VTTRLTRRSLLQTGSAFTAWGMVPRTAFAGNRDPRFVFIILRGALDGLAFMPPVGDPDFSACRGDLALPASGLGAALPLDGFFALNPNMPALKSFYDKGEALLIHAVATPYRDRSHFDGQDVLENGTASPYGSDSGWLNRAAHLIPAGGAVRDRDLFAVGSTIPLVMRGPAPVMNWSPGALRGVDDDTLARLARLYGERDPELLTVLTEGKKIDGLLGRGAMAAVRRGNGAAEKDAFVAAAEAAGHALIKPDGPRIAALAFNGWDTHANEGPASGRLGHLLAALDAALTALRTSLDDAWKDTVVVAATEFGRTARENGTTGTDHGTAAAAFLAGGAVKGGRIIADWPGLKAAALYEGRDLRPTLDLRAVLKGTLTDQLGISERLLATEVFPESSAVQPLSGLLT
jgi:uncharacterized protein (DUF1501 family)